MLTIGLIREGKVPPDKRVPLTPEQCKLAMEKYPDLKIIVQPSVKRCYPDSEYASMGITVSEDMSSCDVLMGVKEVPIPDLIEGKTYFYFSHTIKKQPYNRNLLRKMLELKIRMIDYETLTDLDGNRIIAFGRYAGIVGCYNGFRGYGEKFGLYHLKPAHECFDREEMEKELREKVKLPNDFRIVVTGTGRVGKGCQEIIDVLGIRKVSADEFLNQSFSEPVYAMLRTSDYNKTDDGRPFDSAEFHKDPSRFSGDFLKFARLADMYIPCHFWSNKAPQIIEQEDYRAKDFRIKMIADVSCDIEEPIASTLRSSTIADPFYGYDPRTGKEGDFFAPHTVGVMAVDNLPCELPRDASRDFGIILVNEIFPMLLGNDPDNVLERATICANGKLTDRYSYLQDYADGKE